MSDELTTAELLKRIELLEARLADSLDDGKNDVVKNTPDDFKNTFGDYTRKKINLATRD